jgi:CRISPR-associated protein Cas2
VIVLSLRSAKPSLRGKLSRWMIEPRAGLFVGEISERVRDKLWREVERSMQSKGSAIMVYTARTEQGFAIRMFGDLDREIAEFDGLTLIRYLGRNFEEPPTR